LTLSPSNSASTFDIWDQMLSTISPNAQRPTPNAQRPTPNADFDLTRSEAGRESTGISPGTTSGLWGLVNGVIIAATTEGDLSVAVSKRHTVRWRGFRQGSARFDCAGPSLDFRTGEEMPHQSAILPS